MDYESLYSTATKALNTQLEINETQAKRIAELEAKLEQHRWIPISERLPEFGKRHLAYNPNFEPHVSVEIETGEVHRSHYTHWKPIVLP